MIQYLMGIVIYIITSIFIQKEKSMKKKKSILSFIIIIMIINLSSCMSLLGLWPDVAPPADQTSSMLVVEVGEGVPNESDSLFNSNATGWAPWVIDEKGDLVVFKPFDIESRLDSFFYAENINPGKYTLKGFIHVYIDYGKLDTSQTIASYGPFENYPYHVKQFLPIDEEVIVNLKPATIDTFGRYYITYDWKEGAPGTSDDRWKVLENSIKIISDSADRKALRVAKNWATPNWSLWNERNFETAADE